MLVMQDTETPVTKEPEQNKTQIKTKSKTIVCNANRMFIKDCNRCWCNEDGTSFYCTRSVCSTDPEIAAVDKEELRIIKKTCRPDEVFEVDCNMCRCNPDGQSYSCTRRACFTEPPITELKLKKEKTLRNKRAAPTQEAPKTCTPAQEFRMDCNTCLCDNEGREFSCTRIDCNNNNKPSRRKRDTNNFRCNPGEQTKRGCNDCTCSADGKSVFCTVHLCEDDINANP